MQIYLGADHGGFQLKEEFKNYLSSTHPDFAVEDCGAPVLDLADDYPPIALRVATKVAADGHDGADTEVLGVLLCRTGSGMIITANKVKGIRAVELYNENIALKAKSHNHANIIAFSGDYLDLAEMTRLFGTFIQTPIDEDERHNRRIAQITNYEENREI